MNDKNQTEVEFLQWALPKLGYRWKGFRKPRGQVLQRIRDRIAELRLSGYAGYKSYLKTTPEEWELLDGLLFVTISRFFRDRKLWDALSETIIPELAEKRHPEKVRIWSAGCCNGEEPYSIAIAADLCGHLKNVDILATDRNNEVLKRAKKGLYTESSLKELKPAERKIYFERNDETGEFILKKHINSGVNLEMHDILKSWPVGKFDMIFCRYLAFTYFDETRQQEYLNKIRNSLYPHGFLVIGNNEKLPEASELVQIFPPLPVYGEKIIHTDVDNS